MDMNPLHPLIRRGAFHFVLIIDGRISFNQKPSKSATLNVGGISFNLTPKWKFNTSLGYDFIAEELTPSQFSLNRNLECWDLSFRISPFGDNQYYFFSLRLNSTKIQSLFQKLPILKNLERSSTNTGRSYDY